MANYNPAAQADLLAEKILDSFAGGGGTEITTMEQLEGLVAV